MKKDRLLLVSILLLAALLRWVHLDAPPIGRHAWRQSDTASMARNFHQNDYRLLYPQIDWAVPGYAETEFPIYPWTVAQVYRWTGESMTVARLLAICGSLLSILFLYALTWRILGRRAALWAAFLLAVVPSSLYFGRAIMPEAWMLAAIAAGVYWFYRWVQEASWRWFLLAAAATALAALLKLTALHMGLPLLWLAWRKYGRRTLTQWQIWLFGLMVLAPVAFWYRHAYQLGRTYGASFHIFTGAGADKWGDWSLLFDFSFYSQVFVEILGGRILTWIGLIVLLVALAIRRRSDDERLFDVWLLAVLILILLVNRGSYVHEYYSLPIVLPAVALMSKAFDRAWPKRKILTIGTAIGIIALSGYRYTRYLSAEQAYGPNGESIHPDVITAEVLSETTSPDDLVISCNRANPVWLYLANRKGWGRECKDLTKLEILDLTDRGARLLITRRETFDLGAPLPAAGYLKTFYEIDGHDGRVQTVDLERSRAWEEVDWSEAFSLQLEGPESLENWTFDNNDWQIDGGYLIGASSIRPIQATAQAAFQGCGICRVQTRIRIGPPPKVSNDEFRRRRRTRRARKRQAIVSPRVALRAWRSSPRTFVAVTFDLEEQRIRFQQQISGRAMQAVSLPTKLDLEHEYLLEVRFDGFDFELLLDGESLLIEPSRFLKPPFGTVALQARAARLQVAALTVLSRPIASD